MKKIFLILQVFLFTTFAFAGLNTAYINEIKKQWGYLDLLKTEKDKALQKKSQKLLRAIENHFYANSVKFEIDPKDSTGRILKVLTPSELKASHPLNRFATSLYYKYGQLRVDINPLKLKLGDAGALFSEETNRLTLAFDNILDLKADSFVGHELIHARFYQHEKKGKDHVYMGWLKRQDSAAKLQKTYPDAFSLDELAAYYYQALVLLREAQQSVRKNEKQQQDLTTAENFLDIGVQLARHLVSDEMTSFAGTYLKTEGSAKISFDKDEAYDIVRIETQRYILELNFLKKTQRTEAQLQQQALLRLQNLNSRGKIIFKKMSEALAAVKQERPKEAIQILSSARDLVLRE